MKIRELLLGPDGLLLPHIQEKQFERIHYGMLTVNLDLPCRLAYTEVADRRIKAYLVHGRIINSELFQWRGEIVYLLDGELAAFSWQNCSTCPTEVRFFSQDAAESIKLVLIDLLFTETNVKFVSLDDEFKSYFNRVTK
jgi:hypothetical protein